MIKLVGKRPFKEKTVYEEFVEGTGKEEEETQSLGDFQKEQAS